MVTSTRDPEPKTPAEVWGRIGEIRPSKSGSGRPDLVEAGKTDLFWLDESSDGAPRVGDNVRPDPDTDGPACIVTDPSNGREYHVDIRDLWDSIGGE